MNLDNDEFKILKNMNEISAKENMISTLRIRIEELTKKKRGIQKFQKKIYSIQCLCCNYYIYSRYTYYHCMSYSK